MLILTEEADDCIALEEILQKIVDEGVELLIAKREEDGAVLFKKERPLLVFVDSVLELKDPHLFEGAHFIWITPRHATPVEGREVIFKPFKEHQVLEKCKSVLAKSHPEKILPM